MKFSASFTTVIRRYACDTKLISLLFNFVPTISLNDHIFLTWIRRKIFISLVVLCSVCFKKDRGFFVRHSKYWTESWVLTFFLLLLFWQWFDKRFIILKCLSVWYSLDLDVSLKLRRSFDIKLAVMPPVVQTLDKDIHRINHYSLGSGKVLRRETICVIHWKE